MCHTDVTLPLAHSHGAMPLVNNNSVTDRGLETTGWISTESHQGPEVLINDNGDASGSSTLYTCFRLYNV